MGGSILKTSRKENLSHRITLRIIADFLTEIMEIKVSGLMLSKCQEIKY